MRAMESSHVELVRFLLERGAKSDLRNRSGRTALDIAYDWGDRDTMLVARALIKEEKKEENGEGGGKKGKKTPEKEKKGKGKKKGNGDEGSGMPKLTPDQLSVLAPKPSLPARLPTPMERIELLRQSLSPGNTVSLPAVNRPVTAWGSRPPSTQEFLRRQQSLREQQGENMVDFGEIRSPFTLSIDARVKLMDTEDL